MPDHNYRFGKVEGDLSSYGEFSDIAESIEDGEFPIEEDLDDTTLLKGARHPHYESSDDESSTEYLYFRYVTETVNEAIGLTDDGEDTEVDNYGRDIMDFLLLPDGRFIYESVDNAGAGNAIQIAICFATEEEDSSFEIADTGSISHPVVEDFYHGEFYADDVEYHIKEAVIGGSGEDSAQGQVAEAARGLLQSSNTVTINAGRGEDRDLRHDSLALELVQQGELQKVNSNPIGSAKRSILSTNDWYRFGYAKGVDPGQRASLIYRKAKPILDAVVPSE